MINYDNSPVFPKYDGVKVIELKKISLKNIKRRKNDGRASDFEQDKVKQIESLIQNGDWCPLNHEPPMVVDNGDGTYSLKTGHHRYMAHIGTDETEMWVAVVEFESEEAQILACSHENSKVVKPDVKKHNSVNDIINDTCKLLNVWVKKNDTKITEKLIKKAITKVMIDPKQYKPQEYDTVLETVKKDSGVRGSVKGYTKDEAKKTAEEIHGDSDSGSHIARLRDKKSKADERAWDAVEKHKIEYGADAEIIMYGYFTNSEAKDVKKRRQEVSNLKCIEERVNSLKRKLEIYQDPNFIPPKWIFFSQLYDEGELGND